MIGSAAVHWEIVKFSFEGSDFVHGLVDVADFVSDHVSGVVLWIPLLWGAQSILGHVPVVP